MNKCQGLQHVIPHSPHIFHDLYTTSLIILIGFSSHIYTNLYLRLNLETVIKKHGMAQDKVLQEVTVQSQADKSEQVLNWRGHAVRWKDLV